MQSGFLFEIKRPYTICSVSVSRARFQRPRKVSFSGLPHRHTCHFGRAASIRTGSASRKPSWLSNSANGA